VEAHAPKHPTHGLRILVDGDDPHRSTRARPRRRAPSDGSGATRCRDQQNGGWCQLTFDATTAHACIDDVEAIEHRSDAVELTVVDE
jgi:hypothetical protein